jgi:hypothetical protein
VRKDRKEVEPPPLVSALLAAEWTPGGAEANANAADGEITMCGAAAGTATATADESLAASASTAASLAASACLLAARACFMLECARAVRAGLGTENACGGWGAVSLSEAAAEGEGDRSALLLTTSSGSEPPSTL